MFLINHDTRDIQLTDDLSSHFTITIIYRYIAQPYSLIFVSFSLLSEISSDIITPISSHQPPPNQTATLGFLVTQWINWGLLSIPDNHSPIHSSLTLLTHLPCM